MGGGREFYMIALSLIGPSVKSQENRTILLFKAKIWMIDELLNVQVGGGVVTKLTHCSECLYDSSYLGLFLPVPVSALFALLMHSLP